MNKNKPKLLIDWCSHQAAAYACKNWHYSGCMPVGKISKIGIWENNKFIGCILFSRGATPNLCKPYGLTQIECCELTRIAMTKHETEVSKCLSLALKFLRKQSENLKLVISFADPAQNHHGGIYQATNWIYTGMSNDAKFGFMNGKEIHPRTISELRKKGPLPVNFKWILKKGKHRYLMPLNNEIREKLLKFSKPYPKRIEHESNVS